MSSFALQIAMGIKMGLCAKWGLFLGINGKQGEPGGKKLENWDDVTYG